MPVRPSLLALALLASPLAAQENDSPRPLPVGPSRLSSGEAMDGRDLHSHARPQDVRTTNLDLDLKVDFARKVLEGTVTLDLVRTNPKVDKVLLDTRNLTIQKAEAQVGKAWQETPYVLGKDEAILGAPLEVTLPSSATRIRITYRTAPTASGLQWLEPAQTAGKRQPFLFSQSQAIHARSWVPCQDSPAIRITYSARIRTPKELRAVMSAANDPKALKNVDYHFNMPQAIPSYLLALAVGDLEFSSLGKRSGVYAEPSVLALAAHELEDTEAMITATEKLFGPYRWGRYDLLILPPSFPFGGMENPRLTFATPTILAGDKSLVSLVAHELAHSWSGNLVTNATWRDIWLNEGFTTYVERRIIEAVYGRNREEMEAVLGRRDLQEDLDTLPAGDTILHIDLKDRDPDEGLSKIPYEKGALFLRHLEETYGRSAFDTFVRGYFNHFAFKSITTADFETYLHTQLFTKFPAKNGVVPVMAWIRASSLPAKVPVPASDAFAQVEAALGPWLSGKTPAASLPTKSWTTQEWLHALNHLPSDLSFDRMADLDAAFKLTDIGNAEIAHVWLKRAIHTRYQPAYPRLERYLVSIGRRKLILPLYEELKKTGQLDFAKTVYAAARPGYHPIAQTSVDALLAK